MVVEGKAKAWPLDVLHKTPARNDAFFGQPALVTFDRESVTARLFDRRLNERTLTFHWKDGKLRDDQTGTTWNALTGKAVAGTLAGQHLVPLPAIISFRKVWQQFHPESEIVSSK
ncbi:MAG: DUF3179 domain-containing protein [Gemmataceae bacterium]|nr:DUF3179 domain-containing protein [Gemmataceae bacterium]MCI0742453.1 DUF3179 domain-containing protein [Gemmataceae bacterium]